MNIVAMTLISQVEAAIERWPFITDVELRYRLPQYLLLAVGSRESNLIDEVGDNGHGRGVWQRDDRSWNIPYPYPVQHQAADAGALLRSDLDYFHGDLHKAVASYNCGPGNVNRALRENKPADTYTTGGDYAADVLGRLAAITNFYVATERQVS